MSGKLFKSLGWWSLIGISFSLTNSWLGMASSLVVGLTNGGPILIIYGLIIAMFFASMCSIAICDFSSILPNASGPCFWTLKLLSEGWHYQEIQKDETKTFFSKKDFEVLENDVCPEILEDEIDPATKEDKIYSVTKEDEICAEGKEKYSEIEENEISPETEEEKLEAYCDTKNALLLRKWKKNLSIISGLLNYAGAIFTTSSVCSSLSLSILGVYSLMHSHYTFHRWHAFVAYEILNFFIAIVSSYGKWLPIISQLGLLTSVASYLMTLLVTIISRSLNHHIKWPEAKTIFKDFNNTTRWPPGMTFILGLINPCWAFAGLDSATHMVDDTGYNMSRRLVPKVLVCNVVVGFITSFSYSIVMFYCVTNINSVVNSILPILEIYYQATGNKSLSAFMQSCCIITGIICGFSSSTWQNRILWSVSRTYMHLYHGEIHKPKLKILKKLNTISSFNRIPLYAHIISHIFVLIIGCIFMGSDTAFNAIISACISILYVSYAIPCALLVFYSGRKKFMQTIIQEQKSLRIIPYNFCKGRWALIPHILAICWAIFCLVMFAFPYTLPVTGDNMNYVCVVYGVIALVILVVLIS